MSLESWQLIGLCLLLAYFLVYVPLGLLAMRRGVDTRLNYAVQVFGVLLASAICLADAGGHDFILAGAWFIITGMNLATFLRLRAVREELRKSSEEDSTHADGQ
jgi:hypothetical protein